jgi:uncharacterized hydrophobic protein (TIGR00271 family)
VWRVLHLRVITPPGRTAAAETALQDCVGVTGIVVLPGAARRPAGDLVMCDVAREAANDVIDRLRALGLEADGLIAVEHVDVAISRAADRAEEEAPGDADDAVIWAELAQDVADGSRITWAFLAFLVIATQLAAVAVLLSSPILVVGAMVLGPEFGAVAAVCFGLLRRDLPLIGRAVRALAVGFATGIAVTLACALVLRGLGWIDAGMLVHNDEVRFIVKPDRWSFVVALLAGAAGVLSITADKSSALVGVFISVTTIPASGYAAVALALGEWAEVGGSAAQLAANLAGMVVSGTATLAAQRHLWSRYGMRPLPRTQRRPAGPTGS